MKKQTRRMAPRARSAKLVRSRAKEGRKDSAALDLPPAVFRKLGYRAVDILAKQLESLRDATVRQPVPDDLRRQLMEQPLPIAPVGPAGLLERFAKEVLAYPMGNASPRFFGWVNAPPAPLGVLAEMLGAGLNASLAGGDHAATYVEHGVLKWLKALLGYPATAGGLLASGGSVANLVGLAVMRSAKAQGDIRAQGGRGETLPMVVYTSTQGHSCLEKAVELLGIGHDYLRKIPVDVEYRMDLDALRARILDDRAVGLRPVCVAASAGTVNTGAIDPLDAIADLCRQEGLWFHVDGAYGALGILAEQTRGFFKGMERADSLAVDPHKWMYAPVECGCVLLRDALAMRNTFSLVPPYLRDPAALPWFAEFGPQQTRSFRALKLWMTLQQIGAQGYRELISRDIALARALQARLRRRGDFELVAAGPLSITCFRCAPRGAGDLDQLNRRVLELVQHEGRVFLTSTELNGRFVLRACIVNFRTRESDLDFLLDVLAEAGQRVLRSEKR